MQQLNFMASFVCLYFVADCFPDCTKNGFCYGPGTCMCYRPDTWTGDRCRDG